MTDTEVLDGVVQTLKEHVLSKCPISPMQCMGLLVQIAGARHKDDPRRLVASPIYQNFWRCAHHPEAIANWAAGRGWFCSHGCDENDLRWSDNGCKHPT